MLSPSLGNPTHNEVIEGLLHGSTRPGCVAGAGPTVGVAPFGGRAADL
jgi:hypothetical protein